MARAPRLCTRKFTFPLVTGQPGHSSGPRLRVWDRLRGGPCGGAGVMFSGPTKLALHWARFPPIPLPDRQLGAAVLSVGLGPQCHGNSGERPCPGAPGIGQQALGRPTAGLQTPSAPPSTFQQTGQALSLLSTPGCPCRGRTTAPQAPLTHTHAHTRKLRHTHTCKLAWTHMPTDHTCMCAHMHIFIFINL